MSEPRVAKKDLIVLVADANMREAINQILARHESLAIRPIDFEVIHYIGRADPGCYQQSHNFLLSRLGEFEHALVVFDRKGSGQESRAVEEIEKEVQDRLRQHGWDDKAEVIVIDPELEAWVWGPSRQVGHTLGWRGRRKPLRAWLQEEGLWDERAVKPRDPKRALQRTLRELRIQRSSALYGELANRVGLRNCRDRSFCRLVDTLRNWFPPSQSSE
ncbi:MAG: hypothetical protein Q8Q12_18400 [bacterium]|nr:hypothetical protein [bacterium]